MAKVVKELFEKHAVCPQWNYTIRPRKTGTNF
jgi:hypothetical protein